MELYVTLKFLHLAAAVVWLGGGSAMVLLGTILSRRNDPEGFMALIGHVAVAGPRIFMPASVATLVTGVALVWVGGHGWPAWVVLALAGIAFTALFGALVLGPASERAVAMAARVGARVASQDGRRLLRLANFDYVVQFVVVWLMVAKPGWDESAMLASLVLVILAGAVVFLQPRRRIMQST
ncbi:MAG: DUF2269 family protein [Gemmobacter sp.]